MSLLSNIDDLEKGLLGLIISEKLPVDEVSDLDFPQFARQI